MRFWRVREGPGRSWDPNGEEKSNRILTTLKGIWRILEGGEFLSGP